MSTRLCQACNGAGNVMVPNPVPPPKSVLVVCQKCGGTGEEDYR